MSDKCFEFMLIETDLWKAKSCIEINTIKGDKPFNMKISKCVKDVITDEPVMWVGDAVSRRLVWF